MMLSAKGVEDRRAVVGFLHTLLSLELVQAEIRTGNINLICVLFEEKKYTIYWRVTVKFQNTFVGQK